MKEEDIADALKSFLNSRYAFRISERSMINWAVNTGWSGINPTAVNYLREHNPGMVFWPDQDRLEWVVYTKENPVLFRLKYSEYL